METDVNITRIFPGSKEIVISALDGKTVITEAGNTFKSNIDCDVIEFGLDVKSSSTKETKVLIYQAITEGTFMQIFTSINKDLDKIVLTMSQIIDFCHESPKLVTRESYGLFFLTSKKIKRNFIKNILNFLFSHKADKQYFVARAYAGTEGLGFTVYRLLPKDGEDGAIWPLDKNLLVVCPETVLNLEERKKVVVGRILIYLLGVGNWFSGFFMGATLCSLVLPIIRNASAEVEEPSIGILIGIIGAVIFLFFAPSLRWVIGRKFLGEHYYLGKKIE